VNTDAGAARLSIIDGRISDGSVRNDTSDLITYPFNGTKILFDDLATQVANKKRQMDDADSFEYSGSPAIRPADFQELNLLSDVYSGSGNWLDQSGKGNDAVVIGANHIDYGSYWRLDRSEGNNTITIPYTPNLAFTDAIMSCEAWIYVDTFATNFFIINKRGNNVTQNFNRPYVFDVISDGRVRWILDDSTTLCDTATGLIQTGQWYHLAATHDGTNAKIYINGVENVSVSSGTSSLDDTGDIPVRIGHRYQNTGITYSDGRLGDVRLYSRALTAAQVFQNYNATKSKYINEAPDIAPKIGPSIVYDSNLLLNYDFGNRATYDRAENLITWSEEITNAAWTKVAVNIDPNSTVSPDGLKTADKIYDDTTSGTQHYTTQSFSKEATTYTGSVYVKAAEYTKLAVGFTGVANWQGIPQALFDLVSEEAAVLGADTTATINSVGNGWYRVSITSTSLNTTASALTLSHVSDSGTNTGGGNIFLGHDGDGVSGLYIWGAQVEKGSTPGRYIKTYGTAITAPTTVKNLSSSSYTGTINGATFNSAGYFVLDGVDDYFDNGNIALTASGGWTVELWFKPNQSTHSSGTWNYLFRDAGAGNPVWECGFYSTGLTFSMKDNAVPSNANVVEFITTNGQWHYLAVGIDSSTHTFLTGSSVAGTLSTDIKEVAASSGVCEINTLFCNELIGNFLGGEVGEIRIYDRALTLAERTQNFNATRSKYGV
jgi:hypothetical protein